ncbi:hypothetical protein GLOIN_2v1883550 [Rhizophagus irregularis DAOM 181602=DAOM 197198]|nr:hypothetical protein GLOIN_2v1883550 [Rhizophagus irregularis DAOM 181602=DAOM 197198]
MLFQFIAELPDENIAGLLELKVAGRKTLPDFGIKVSQTKNMIGFLELRLCYGVFKQENLKVLKISLDTTDSLLSLDIDFDSFSTLWTWKFDGLFLSSLDVKFGENIPLTRRFVFQVFR